MDVGGVGELLRHLYDNDSHGGDDNEDGDDNDGDDDDDGGDNDSDDDDDGGDNDSDDDDDDCDDTDDYDDLNRSGERRCRHRHRNGGDLLNSHSEPRLLQAGYRYLGGGGNHIGNRSHRRRHHRRRRYRRVIYPYGYRRMCYYCP
uniref:Uncharacterized protein n=1 Tax=Trichobilharzia regenti TaxID=157069 RepID=A0AA85JPL0_TRIRE|nr:unnamed protein product [Trichobilharzia regenti]